MEMEFNDRRKDDEAGKSSATKRQLDDYQPVEIVGNPRNRVVDSPVKRRLRNIDIRRKAIDQFEEEMIDFVWDHLSANHAEKFSNSDAIFEYSGKIVKEKILHPEISSYSKVIEVGGSWTDFKVNKAREKKVKKFLEEIVKRK